ncbi:MAG: hypothetical protein RLY71_1243 [Pseudomonadota bacterium]
MSMSSPVLHSHPVATRRLVCAVLASLGLWLVSPAEAREPNASELSGTASGLSVALPVAMSVAGSVLIFSAATTLVVVSVQATAYGSVWVLQRVSDGMRVSVRWSAEGARAASMAVGTTLEVTALSAGWLLTRASEAMAFIPNELGGSLIFHEQMTF